MYFWNGENFLQMESPLKRLASISSLLVGIVLLSPVCPLPAQTASPQPYTFSPQAKAVIDRLGTFDSIPADTWQYHAGDIAHGERPDLDTAGWKTLHLP